MGGERKREEYDGVVWERHNNNAVIAPNGKLISRLRAQRGREISFLLFLLLPFQVPPAEGKLPSEGEAGAGLDPRQGIRPEDQAVGEKRHR